VDSGVSGLSGSPTLGSQLFIKVINMSLDISIHDDPTLIEEIKNIALMDYKEPGKLDVPSQERYLWLKELGSELWLDTGDAALAESVWSPETNALTTNNTLVNQVVQTGVMDGLIVYAKRKIKAINPDISEHDLIIEIAFLINAKLALSLVSKFGAKVSVELHPDTGNDVENTLIFARRYYAINPDNFYVKVPLTPDGFVATRKLSAEGIPVNFTLGFSARQNYLAARYSNPSYVNVFLGRLNQLVEENGLGEPENIGEKATLASYEAVSELRKVRTGAGTLQIAASMRSGNQVATLAGVDVLTIPPKVAAEYLAMEISESDVRKHASIELPVKLNPDRMVEAGELIRLWEIDAGFVAFVEDAVQQAQQISCGKELIELSYKHDVNLFREWTPEDRNAIRQKGKIPDVSDWPGAPIDDLMSVSALESFAKDQSQLDQRIADL